MSSTTARRISAVSFLAGVAMFLGYLGLVFFTPVSDKTPQYWLVYLLIAGTALTVLYALALLLEVRCRTGALWVLAGVLLLVSIAATSVPVDGVTETSTINLMVTLNVLGFFGAIAVVLAIVTKAVVSRGRGQRP